MATLLDDITDHGYNFEWQPGSLQLSLNFNPDHVKTFLRKSWSRQHYWMLHRPCNLFLLGIRYWSDGQGGGGVRGVGDGHNLLRSLQYHCSTSCSVCRGLALTCSGLIVSLHKMSYRVIGVLCTLYLHCGTRSMIILHMWISPWNRNHILKYFSISIRVRIG